MAEREGFEPSVACTTHDFQSCTFSHSVTSPRLCLECIIDMLSNLRPRIHDVMEKELSLACWKTHVGLPTKHMEIFRGESRHVIMQVLLPMTHEMSSASGEGGIRTHGGVAPTPDFESGSFGLSDTSPVIWLHSQLEFYRRNCEKNERSKSAHRASSTPLRTETL